MQSAQTEKSDESLQQLIPARTIFSVRPTDPPSSPPPTSPLPPLPKIAHYRPARSTSSISPVPRFDRPRRPPRPSVSLSDLKPRTIQSPEIARRQRSAELAAQTRLFSSTEIQPPKERSNAHTEASPEKRASIRLLTATPESTANFSDDVLSALPKLFQRSSPTSSRGDIASRTITPTDDEDDRVRAWQVYHGTFTKGSLRYKRSRKETSKPIARSALFVPNRPFPTRRDSLQHRTVSPQPYGVYNHSAEDEDHSSHALFSPFHSPKKQKHKDVSSTDTTYMHLGGLSINTNIPFDFGHTASLPSYTSQASVDNLTSLPQIPSTSSLAQLESSRNDGEVLCTLMQSKSSPQTREPPMSPAEAAVFTSLRYSQTIDQAGPSPNMYRGQAGNQGGSFGSEMQSSQLLRRTYTIQESETPGEEENQPLTEEQRKKVRQKRLMWAISTIALVLLATAGILGGIIWKLNNL